jgi:hypothetical protein
MFFKILAKLASSSVFSLAVGKQLAKNIERVRERGKSLARLVSRIVFLFANPEFYSHLASWRVVNRTPSIYNVC